MLKVDCWLRKDIKKHVEAIAAMVIWLSWLPCDLVPEKMEVAAALYQEKQAGDLAAWNIGKCWRSGH